MKGKMILLMVALLLVLATMVTAVDGPMAYAYIAKTKQAQTYWQWHACLVHVYYGTIKVVPCYSKADAIMVVQMMGDRWNIPYYTNQVIWE